MYALLNHFIIEKALIMFKSIVYPAASALALAMSFGFSAALYAENKDEQADCAPMFKHSMRRLHSQDTVDLCQLTRNKPVLLVNTASHCGYTKQFAGLETLHQQYQDQGLVVLGFASNDFYQAAKDEAEAAKVCFVNFGVNFVMLAPSSVKGDAANPVFQQVNTQAKAPGWNFTKYLIDANGDVVERFSSHVTPGSQALNHAIQKTLVMNDSANGLAL
jgi:glutathione peroxidase